MILEAFVLVQVHGATWVTPLDSFKTKTEREAVIQRLNVSADKRGWPRPQGYECWTREEVERVRARLSR